jgi:hypothetical protein
MTASGMDTSPAGQNDLDREIRAARRLGAIFPTAVPETSGRRQGLRGGATLF